MTKEEEQIKKIMKIWNNPYSINNLEVMETLFKIFQEGRQEALADEIKWLEETFKDIRNARTEVSGLSWLQFKVNDRIEKLQELKAK